METAILGKILDTTEITNDIGTRIEPLQLPDHPTLPALVYQRIDRTEDHGHDGPTGAPGARLQIDIYANTYAVIKRIATNLRQTLNGFAGTLQGIVIEHITLVNEIEQPEAAPANYRMTQDYIINWQET